MGKFKAVVAGVRLCVRLCVKGRVIGRFILLNFVLTGLFITTICYADIQIYCPKCHKHLYDYKGEEIPRPVDNRSGLNIKDVVPVEGVPVPTEQDKFVCPYDQAPLNGWEYWFWEKGRPLPKMVYPAISVLTKDASGEWVWVPDEVKIKDCLTKKCLEGKDE